MKKITDPDYPIGFCGDPFWDDFRPVYNQTSQGSPLPLLTDCFQHTVLVAIPCLFFWVLLPVLSIQLRLSEKHPLPWTTIMSMKWLVSIMIIVDRAFVLLLGIWETVMDDEDVPTVDLVYPALQTLTFLTMSFMKDACRRKGLRSSGVLFCTWLLFVVCGVMEFYSWLVIGSDQQLVAETDFFRYIAYLAYYPLLLIQLFLMCFSDPLTVFSGYENANNPYSSASFLNRQTLWWFSSLVTLGNKRPLELEDVFDLDEEMKPDYLQKKWKSVWDNEERNYHLNQRSYAAQQREEFLASAQTDTTPLLGKSSKNYGMNGKEAPTEETKTDPRAPKLPSIVKCMWRLFKWEILSASLIKISSDLLQFANPIFLNLMITFTEDPLAPWYEGLAYAFGLGFSSSLRSLLMNNYFTEMFRLGCQLQAVLTTAVYEKTLRLSSISRREKTVGEIVNLMAIDVERFKSITPQLQQYWSSPLQIILTLIFLWQTVGWAVISGVFVMLLVIPVNFAVSIFCRKWQVQQMRLKDQRIKMTNEVLSGIKVIKLYAWESAMEKTIDDIRRQEIQLVRKASLIRNSCDIFNVSSPFLVALCTFSTYTLIDSRNVLTPQIAFVSLALFNQLRSPLMMAADLISQTVQAIVSNKRLKEFLVADELIPTAVDRESRSEYYEKSVEADNVCWTWDRDVAPVLKDVDMDVKSGQLIAVVGRVGAGKSSLLSGILGEMEKLRGYIGVRGTIAYVSQQPWIQNISLRDNIIMEKAFNEAIYNEVLDACALRQDLELLPAGDLTEIGEKGINLSGGQKARVALARAVYQDRDIILLDDPLSAVDAHVARHIFEKVIGPTGVLKEKTRVLVTHGITFLKESDVIAVVKDSTVTHLDTFDNLSNDAEAQTYLQEAVVQKKEELTPESSRGSEGNGSESDAETETEEVRSTVSKRSKLSSVKKPRAAQTSKLIEKEKAETGRVKPQVYMDYFRAMGLFTYTVPFMILLIIYNGLIMMRSFWLTGWSNENIIGANPQDALSLGTRLGVYAGLGLTEIVFLFLSMFCLIIGGVNASLNLHAPLLHNILRSPLSFFDVTPLGRILNRLGKDMEVVDLRLSGNFRFLALSFMNVLQVIVMISIVTPLFIVVIVPVLIIYVFILRYFIHTSRQLQRLASITRSPIYSHFGESIQGASTIRAFGWVHDFIELSKEKLEKHLRCSYFSLMSNRWLSVRLELLGNVIIFSTALLAIISKSWGTVTAGVIGLSVSYSLNITFMLNMFVRQISEVETNVVSVERIKEYSQTPTEASWKGLRALPLSWPDRGIVEIRNLAARYRPGLDMVLNNLTVNFGSGEKIGVVGRTGAGKSSLALVLFRIIEPCGGSIVLDGVDITSIGLHDLRKKITVIPQDPVLFSGTLRFNLDPTEDHSDADLWRALEHANMKDFVETLPKGLYCQIDEGGENISVGQRQLVCLTRALLRKSQILMLDEATAAVDTHTDALIQETIRKEFAKATVITIAHRLNTIMDYDKILVMKGGSIAEFAPPDQLLNDTNSIFYGMAKSAGLV